MNSIPALPTALLFSGQGAQYTGMCRDLHEHSPEVRELFAQAAPELPPDFLKVCFEGPAETLTNTAYCQPALYLHGLSLFCILRSRLPTLSITAAAGLSLALNPSPAGRGRHDGLRLVLRRMLALQKAAASSPSPR
ncbi:MAG: [acyl-carrier-protein] S-malonyltransferase, partial [Bdellovibrionaceae bacterium]|nr:[acyl-carrier-protein] S-malonyltransferase [Pseudobdellovibrionaceae bacterium]